VRRSSIGWPCGVLPTVVMMLMWLVLGTAAAFQDTSVIRVLLQMKVRLLTTTSSGTDAHESEGTHAVERRRKPGLDCIVHYTCMCVWDGACRAVKVGLVLEESGCVSKPMQKTN
jgi:hypothetical protein